MESLVKSCNACWVWSGMPNILQNSELEISLGKLELFYLCVACRYTPREATVLSSCFSWLWFGMPKVL